MAPVIRCLRNRMPQPKMGDFDEGLRSLGGVLNDHALVQASSR
jgi:hypothetical protein